MDAKMDQMLSLLHQLTLVSSAQSSAASDQAQSASLQTKNT